MRRICLIFAAGAALSLAACGHNTEQKAATGAAAVGKATDGK